MGGKGVEDEVSGVKIKEEEEEGRQEVGPFICARFVAI